MFSVDTVDPRAKVLAARFYVQMANIQIKIYNIQNARIHSGFEFFSSHFRDRRDHIKQHKIDKMETSQKSEIIES